MSISELLEKVTRLPRPVLGESQVPPLELVGFFVYWVRSMQQLKKASLASLAGVSLSTVERIERGERVNPLMLDRVGAALGYEAGYLTSSRLPLTREEVAQDFTAKLAHLEPVKVASIRSQSQIRALAHCHSFLPFVPEEDDGQAVSLHGLIEWLDLAAFLTGAGVSRANREESPKRELYKRILACVRAIERNGCTVLGGVMKAPQPAFPEWEVAVLTVTSKAKDPGASKRRVVFVDKRCVEWKAHRFGDSGDGLP